MAASMTVQRDGRSVCLWTRSRRCYKSRRNPAATMTPFHLTVLHVQLICPLLVDLTISDQMSWSCIGFAPISLAPNAAALALVLVFFEFTSIFWSVVSLSYRQRAIPDALLGRVNGIYRLLSWGRWPWACYYPVWWCGVRRRLSLARPLCLHPSPWRASPSSF